MCETCEAIFLNSSIFLQSLPKLVNLLRVMSEKRKLQITDGMYGPSIIYNFNHVDVVQLVILTR